MTINAIGDNYIKIAPAGEITYPSQCAFRAILAADKLNVTGNGTTYTIPFDTEDYDQNADFNAGTGIFVAPVTGKYQLTLAVLLTGGGTKTTLYASIYNNTAVGSVLFGFNTLVSTTLDAQAIATGTVLLTAGDNLIGRIQGNGSGSDGGDVSSNDSFTYFCGHLVC